MEKNQKGFDDRLLQVFAISGSTVYISDINRSHSFHTFVIQQRSALRANLVALHPSQYRMFLESCIAQ